MSDKDGKITDRREMLKIKLKSLAAEARIIKHAERKTHGALRGELTRHRKDVVRRAARETHMAYGPIRGRSMEQIENMATKALNWDAVAKMLKGYGPAGMVMPPPIVEREKMRAMAAVLAQAGAPGLVLKAA